MAKLIDLNGLTHVYSIIKGMLADKLGKNDTAVNASKVNNLTVETAVPKNAKFTDTVYTHPSTHPASMITGLSTVATSGSYNDLTDKPTIPAASTVDSELSSTSTNPVQNKVIKVALDGKLGKNETAARAAQDGAGNTISTTYAKKTDISGMVKSVNGTKPDAGGNVNVEKYTHPNSGVTAGTYRSVTVNAQGHITEGSNPVIAISEGGTGANNASGARTNLGLGSVATENIVPISKGGTGATTVEQARANLGISSSNGEIIGSGAGYHNCIYRGKDLGSTVTTAQWIAIKSGTFDDMYLGDYWTIGGVDWVIMAFDYYLNCGDIATTAHHIVIVPRTELYSAKMNTSSTVEGGYVGSAMYTTNLADAKTTIANAFGSSHLLTIRQSFVNAATDGYSTKGTWTDATVWLMNELNVYGGKIFGDYSIQGTTLPYLDTIDNAQYPAFMFNPSLIKIRKEYWLRDVANYTAFAFVNYNGLCGNRYTSSAIGVRPAFCIYQS